MDEGKGCRRTKASSSLVAFVVIGDRSLSDCAVAIAKPVGLSVGCPFKMVSSARANIQRTQYMLHALICGSLLDGL